MKYPILLLIPLLVFIGCSNDLKSEYIPTPPDNNYQDLPSNLNFDADILTNEEEEYYSTNPRHHDTDGDKVNDDKEMQLDTNPVVAEDWDQDGMYDDFEMQIILFDESDSYSELSDVYSSDDFDEDGRTNYQEFEWGTNPTFAEPNILFIYPEDMGYYTSERGTREPNSRIEGIHTPNMDQLAAEGVNFIHTFVSQSVCSPSKGAIYSGLLPHSNGIWKNSHNAHPVHGKPNNWIPLPDPITPGNDPTNLAAGGMHEDLPNLVQMLKANGVYCALTGKLHVQPARNFPYDIFLDKTDLETAIAEANGRPWFFWANPADTHAPFWRTIQSKLEDPEDPNSAPKDVDPHEITMLPWLPDTEKSRVDVAQYYSNVHNIDDFVGTMMSTLSASGQEDQTLVIFSPDHGIPVQRGKTSIYPAGTHVPCFIKGPGVSGGRTLQMPVSQIDFNPTILEAYGITPQKNRHGESLWPVLRGIRNDIPERKTIMIETNIKNNSAPRELDNSVARAVCDGRYYYIKNVLQDTWTGNEEDAIYIGSGSGEYGNSAGIYYNDLHNESIRIKESNPLPYELLRQLCMNDAPEEELYDLSADPWAVNNFVDDPDYAAVLDRMRNEMEMWRSKSNDNDQHPSASPRRTEK